MVGWWYCEYTGDGGGEMAEIYSKSQTFTDAALFIGAVSVFLIEQRAGRNFEPILEFVPNRHHPVLIVGIARPNRHLVIFLPDLYPSSANILACIVKGLANQTQQCLEPNAVQIGRAFFLVGGEQPTAPAAIAIVLPFRHNAVFEQHKVTPGWQFGWKLNMIVNRPEVLDRAECGDGTAIVLPLFSFFVFEEPQCPFVLQRVLLVHLCNGLSRSDGRILGLIFMFLFDLNHLVVSVFFYLVALLVGSCSSKFVSVGGAGCTVTLYLYR